MHLIPEDKKMKKYLSSIAGTFALLLTLNASAQEHTVPYPTDYRNWTHVKSMLIQPEHPLANPFQGIHHVYANAKAVTGFKSGNFPNGSILVFDLLNYEQKKSTLQEAQRKLIGVMHKDTTKYAETGGWGFEGFAGDSKTERLTQDGGKSCYACHTPQKKDDYVYSRYRP